MTSPDDMQADVTGWIESIWLEERKRESRGKERGREEMTGKQLIPASNQVSLNIIYLTLADISCLFIC